MKINIVYILESYGFEVVRQLEYKYFKLKFNNEKLESMEADYKKGLYDYDIYGEYDVEVKEVGFNGLGNLYIVLDSLGDEHFKKGDCFDVIEY